MRTSILGYFGEELNHTHHWSASSTSLELLKKIPSANLMNNITVQATHKFEEVIELSGTVFFYEIHKEMAKNGHS